MRVQNKSHSAFIREFVTYSERKKPFMISMLKNSSLSEHDLFTDMHWRSLMWRKLQSRVSIRDFFESDLDHLANDILRAYKAIII